jgi:hypothetical protein
METSFEGHFMSEYYMIASREAHMQVSRFAIAITAGIKIIVGRQRLQLIVQAISYIQILSGCELIAQPYTRLYSPAIAEGEILRMYAGIQHGPVAKFMLPGHVSFHQVAIPGAGYTRPEGIIQREAIAEFHIIDIGDDTGHYGIFSIYFIIVHDMCRVFILSEGCLLIGFYIASIYYADGIDISFLCLVRYADSSLDK